MLALGLAGAAFRAIDWHRFSTNPAIGRTIKSVMPSRRRHAGIEGFSAAGCISRSGDIFVAR
jgi:hypothetical protein